MIHTIITALLKRRHFWRHANFSEVAELYASRALRMLALNMITVFVAAYLYQNGYSVLYIALYFSAMFAFKTLIAVPCGHFIARYGPKHGTLASNLLYIPALIIFIYLPDIGLPALVAFGIMQATSATMYDLCYLIDFSKVKHADHAGKEIGYMNIVEKIATGLSPLLGGFAAYIFGPQATILVAAVLFAVAAIPLLFTGEPVKTHQKLSFKNFPYKKVFPNMRAELALGFDTGTAGSMWSLYVVVFVLGITSDAVYAQLGALSSITLIAALLVSHVFGKVIDKNRGKELLRYSVIFNALTHLSRIFVQTPSGVAAANIAKEAGVTGYSMPFLRGMFDAADRLPGYRIAYMTLIEIMINFGAMLATLVLAAGVYLWGEKTGFHALFAVGAVVILLIGSHRFPLYRRS